MRCNETDREFPYFFKLIITSGVTITKIVVIHDKSTHDKVIVIVSLADIAIFIGILLRLKSETVNKLLKKTAQVSYFITKRCAYNHRAPRAQNQRSSARTLTKTLIKQEHILYRYKSCVSLAIDMS